MSKSAADAVRFQPASDQSLLVSFGHGISRDAHEQVRKLLFLLQSEPVAAIHNLHPAYCSLLIKFDPLQLGHDELEAILRPVLARLVELRLPEPRQVEIPVCYGGDLGPDLEDVAAQCHVPPDRVAEVHASVTYVVYFLGFVPGFAYLGELPEALATPRLPMPRRSVAPGSVAIAGRQTGIYPLPTPGGWRLIGRTPLVMFRREGAQMCRLSIGDHVRFVPISRERFAALEGT
jgi:inhibitor of KinA